MNERAHIGLDVHKDTIAVAMLRPSATEVNERVISDTCEAIRRLLARHDPDATHACYEGRADRIRHAAHDRRPSLWVRRDRALAHPPQERLARQDRSHRRTQPRAAPSRRRAHVRARPRGRGGGGARPHPRARGDQVPIAGSPGSA